MNASSLLTEGLPSRLGLRIGWMLSALVIVFLLFHGTIQLVPLPVVNQTLVSLGYADSHALTLACALLYAWPRISLFGPILMTVLMGGAMATHLRAGSPMFRPCPVRLLCGRSGMAGIAAARALAARVAALRGC